MVLMVDVAVLVLVVGAAVVVVMGTGTGVGVGVGHFFIGEGDPTGRVVGVASGEEARAG